MVDFDATLYAPVHELLAVTAILTAGSCEDPITVQAIDKTSGVAIALTGDSEVQTIRPAVAIRMSVITALDLILDELDGGTVEFNGKTWQIDSHLLVPSPQGELMGEVLLILNEMA